MSLWRIGQLARATGVTRKALRYYDQVGLLRPDARSAAGYRLYGEAAVERLDFIRGARRLGLSLRDVREILEISDGGRAPCAHVLALVDRELAELDAHLERLLGLKRALFAARGRLTESLPAGTPSQQGCQCLMDERRPA
ncbi:MAG: MerR family transcriptional regulator [Chloroflexi bacterium]|nr:MerR family transcriptional regulator [Chloroflexota bacterium]